MNAFTTLQFYLIIILASFSWDIKKENSADPDQTPQKVAPDHGVHCLQSLKNE